MEENLKEELQLIYKVPIFFPTFAIFCDFPRPLQYSRGDENFFASMPYFHDLSCIHCGV